METTRLGGVLRSSRHPRAGHFRAMLVVCLVLAPPSPSWAASRRPNHLIGQKRPYLLQHAYNPVDWYPWGEEAFARARRENKPIFLSIGYSTCHWCHVMERESFENESSVAQDRRSCPFTVHPIYARINPLVEGARPISRACVARWIGPTAASRTSRRRVRWSGQPLR